MAARLLPELRPDVVTLDMMLPSSRRLNTVPSPPRRPSRRTIRARGGSVDVSRGRGDETTGVEGRFSPPRCPRDSSSSQQRAPEKFTTSSAPQAFADKVAGQRRGRRDRRFHWKGPVIVELRATAVFATDPRAPFRFARVIRTDGQTGVASSTFGMGSCSSSAAGAGDDGLPETHLITSGHERASLRRPSVDAAWSDRGGMPSRDGATAAASSSPR